MTPQHRRRPAARESGIVQRVRSSLHRLSAERPHILLACSGGKDSVALAWALAELGRLDLLRLSIAHIHHGQHELADVAAEAVQQAGRVLDVPVAVRNLDPDSIAAHAGVGREEALRRERYLALGAIAAETGADAIALAHHQADQAETVLLHLLRGSGLNGLTGMREWEMRRIPWWNDAGPAKQVGIWRPLIHETVDEVAAIAAASGLPVVEDPTNTDTAYRRNAIRHQLLPVIESISPGSTAAVARAAHLIAPDVDLLNDLAARHRDSCQEGDRLSRRCVIDLPVSLQRRVVRAWLEELLPSEELTFDRVTAVLDMAHRNRGGARVQIGAGQDVVLQCGYLVFDPWQNRGD
jgi:tRNA(Ile)-lysidine synthase